MAKELPLKAVIFDLGDVLFKWSASTKTCIPETVLRQMLSTDAWKELDCGLIDRDEAYGRLAQQFSTSAEEVCEAFTQARGTVQPNVELITLIRELKGDTKIFAMSNISKEDYDFLKPQIAEWSIFDAVYASGYVGMRKPDTAFYHYVLDDIRMRPQEVAFVDDRAENVMAARSVGIRSIKFDAASSMTAINPKMACDPCEKGTMYLVDNVKRLQSITDSGVTIHDNFARLLIQDIMPFSDLVEAQWKRKRTWNFFIGKPELVPGNQFPDDLDTTSLALTVLPPDEKLTASILDEMLQYVHQDGTFQTYFDWSKPRTDEVVSANVLACFYRFGRGHQLARTLKMVHDLLVHRTYLGGTRYYPHPDCCLFFIGRVLRASDDPDLHTTLAPLLKTRLGEQVGKQGSAIELAMRIITCHELGVDCDVDVGPLLASQQGDGGWPVSWMYRYGSTGIQLGNRGVTTAMAVKALACVS